MECGSWSAIALNEETLTSTRQGSTPLMHFGLLHIAPETNDRPLFSWRRVTASDLGRDAGLRHAPGYETSGFVIRNPGNRERSRSSVQSSSTRCSTQIAAIRASCTAAP